MVRAVIGQGLSYRKAAALFHVDPKTVQRWTQRYRRYGHKGLYQRSSRPKCQPRRTPKRIVRQVIARRRQRWTMDRIAMNMGISRATVCRILQRNGLNRLSALEIKPPPQRYQHENPGDLLHLDIKKLGRFERVGHRITGRRVGKSRGAGWEYVHVAIDDCSRIAHSKIQDSETADAAVDHLLAAVRYYRSLGVTIRRVLTDNGACYRSRKFAAMCRCLGIRHRFTRPYTPRTNGKAERFIQTALREWAYAFAYTNSTEREQHLPRWLHDYNWHRQHGSLNHQTPISTLGLSGDNLMRLHN